MELWLARQPLTPRTPKEEVKTIMYHVGELLSMLVAAASGEHKGRLAGQQLEKQYHDGFIDIESILLLRTESEQKTAAAVFAQLKRLQEKIKREKEKREDLKGQMIQPPPGSRPRRQHLSRDGDCGRWLHCSYFHLC